MSRTAWLAAVLLPILACNPPQTAEPGAAEDPGPAVARVGDETIHESELEDWLREDLYEQTVRDKDEAELYEFRAEGLERLIGARLLEDVTEREGIEVDELHARTIEGATVSDDEVRAFYEENRSRMGGQSFETMAPRIRDYLENRAQSAVWSAYLDGLREDAGVEILLEPPRMEVAPVGPARGPEDAPVTIVEFSDFNCPYCQRVTTTLETLRLRYPERVRLVYRHFPLDMHPRARPLAEASVCADEQGAFWEFHDRVFETAAPLADDAIRDLAASLELDLDAFEACLDSGRAASVVEQDLRDGAAVGVTGTPAFFVNGIPLSGAQPAEAFVKLIERELAAAGELAGGEETSPSS
jgi:predicted DsbA family dithiol-disulfide isomerase